MGYLLAQEWAALMLSLALAAVRKFMVTELQWLTLHRNVQKYCHGLQISILPGIKGIGRSAYSKIV